jgi:AGZA family xanthine/uracil permease-like MFS transporter
VRTPSWWSPGDWNAFFALLLDNVVNLVLLGGLLSGAYGMPLDFVLERMIPGTALGVLLGDLAYSFLAIRKGPGATAMPLGLDTPSTIGMAVAVIGPVFAETGDPRAAWQVGMATLFCMGIVKTLLAFAGDRVARVVPTAGLLGPLAGVGLALLGLFPMVRIFSEPVAGLAALGLVLFALVAGFRLPGRFPGALAAVIVGTLVHLAFVAFGLRPSGEVPALSVGWHWPLLRPGELWAGLPRALDFLPVSIPFGLLTIVGGIDVTASAREAGDCYRTRDILLVEALATVVAAAFGGVAQSTPYIGHPAYKAMGARSGYTLATGLVVGLGASVGLLGAVVGVLPEVAVAPILLFIGLEVTGQAFRQSPHRHWPAVGLSILPSLAYLVTVYTGQLLAAGAQAPASLVDSLRVLELLGRGFILTAMLWGSVVVFLVDRRPGALVLAFLVLAGFSLFGVVHSTDPAGGLTVPWGPGSRTPLELAAAYLLAGGILAGLLVRERGASGGPRGG